MHGRKGGRWPPRTTRLRLKESAQQRGARHRSRQRPEPAPPSSPHAAGRAQVPSLRRPPVSAPLHTFSKVPSPARAPILPGAAYRSRARRCIRPTAATDRGPLPSAFTKCQRTLPDDPKLQTIRRRRRRQPAAVAMVERFGGSETAWRSEGVTWVCSFETFGLDQRLYSAFVFSVCIQRAVKPDLRAHGCVVRPPGRPGRTTGWGGVFAAVQYWGLHQGTRPRLCS